MQSLGMIFSQTRVDNNEINLWKIITRLGDNAISLPIEMCESQWIIQGRRSRKLFSNNRSEGKTELK